MTIAQWSTTAASNASGVTGVNWAEGMPPSAVNDSARAVMADVATWLGQASGAIPEYLTSVSGTNTIAATGPSQMAGYVAGQRFTFLPANTITGAATINITPSGASALGAKSIFYDGRACVGGEVVAAVPCEIVYDGTQFNILGPSNISRLTADSSPDRFSDYVQSYDASATAYKKVLMSDVAGPQSGTSQATTSGTSIDFTGIPAGVKRVTLNLVGVSTGGTDFYYVQIGPSGGVVTSGYLGASTTLGAGAASSNFTAAFGIRFSDATNPLHGRLVFELEKSSSNTWTCSGICAQSGAAQTITTAGSISLSGALSKLRLTTSGGTDAFDAGEVNILYE